MLVLEGKPTAEGSFHSYHSLAAHAHFICIGGFSMLQQQEVVTNHTFTVKPSSQYQAGSSATCVLDLLVYCEDIILCCTAILQSEPAELCREYLLLSLILHSLHNI